MPNILLSAAILREIVPTLSGSVTLLFPLTMLLKDKIVMLISLHFLWLKKRGFFQYYLVKQNCEYEYYEYVLETIDHC